MTEVSVSTRRMLVARRLVNQVSKSSRLVKD